MNLLFEIIPVMQEERKDESNRGFKKFFSIRSKVFVENIILHSV